MTKLNGGALARLALVTIALLAARPNSAAQAEDFALRDGDTVAFLGDSITAARGYTKIVEHYALLRYPDRQLKFYNAGKGGDTAQTSIQRLQRDVFDRHATVVLVALGVNDIGWGMKADAEHKQAYLDGVRTLIERCRDKGVRVILCSPAITAEPADKAEAGFLQTMADEGLALAKSLGAGAIDVQRGMRAIQRPIEAFNAAEPDPARHVTLHAADGVHLNELGQLAMAFAILKGLGAPPLVSSLSIDAATGKLLAAEGCQASDIQTTRESLAFTRLDAGLPLNRGALSSLDYRWIPIPDQLNQYLLRVVNLPPGDYAIRADGRAVQTVTADQLAQGINIASMTADGWEPGGPWNVQADVLKELVDARDKLVMAERLRQFYDAANLADAALRQAYADLDTRLVDLQRQTARPRPFRFEITRAPTK